MPKTKTSLYVIGATLVTVIVLFVLPITPKVPVSTAVIEWGSLIRTQSVEGRVCYQNEQPCVSLTSGQIAQVYVSQGQRVQKGDPLVRLDTALEEKAIQALGQALYRQEEAVSALAGGSQQDMVEAMWLQSKLSLQQQLYELTSAVELKTLRAASSGVVGQVYAVEGGYVAELSPLLILHGQELEIQAQQRFQDSTALTVGIRAAVYVNGKPKAVAALTGFDAPVQDSATGLYTQCLHFSIVEGADGLTQKVGESVSLEIIEEVQEKVPLAPMAAVSESNTLWLVQDGKVSPVMIEPEKWDEAFVRVPEEFIGQKVVLLPDEELLTRGSFVKESKK